MARVGLVNIRLLSEGVLSFGSSLYVWKFGDSGYGTSCRKWISQKSNKNLIYLRSHKRSHKSEKICISNQFRVGRTVIAYDAGRPSAPQLSPPCCRLRCFDQVFLEMTALLHASNIYGRRAAVVTAPVDGDKARSGFIYDG